MSSFYQHSPSTPQGRIQQDSYPPKSIPSPPACCSHCSPVKVVGAACMLRAVFWLGTGLGLWEKSREAGKPRRDTGYKETAESSRHNLLFAVLGLAPKTVPEGKATARWAVIHLLSDQSVGPFCNPHSALSPAGPEKTGAALPSTQHSACSRLAWGSGLCQPAGSSRATLSACCYHNPGQIPSLTNAGMRGRRDH